MVIIKNKIRDINNMLTAQTSHSTKSFHNQSIEDICDYIENEYYFDDQLCDNDDFEFDNV